MSSNNGDRLENLSSSDSNNNPEEFMGLTELRTVNRYKESLNVAAPARVLRRCSTDENELSNISNGFPGKTKLSVVLITLVDLLAASYEKDEQRKRLLSKEICKSLVGLDLIHPTFLLQQMEGLRAQYSLAFHKLVSLALKKLPQNASLPAIMGPDRNLVLSSVNLHNLYKLSRYKEDFIEEGTLGSGGFGVVFRAKNKLDNATYAVKKVFVKITKEELVIKILREVTVFAKVSHPNIVGYKSAWLEPFVGEINSSSDDSGGTNPSSPAISRSERSLNNDSFSVQFADTQSFQSREEANLHSVNRKAVFLPNQRQKVDFIKELQGTPPDWSEDIEIVRGRPTRPSESELSVSRLSEDKELSEKIGKFWLGDTNSSECGFSENDTQSENKAVISYKSYEKRGKPSLQLECAVLFIQMDLCQKTLREWLDDRNALEAAVDDAQCFSIFQQVLKAVAYLHENGILHRDIKPRNIFVDPGLQVKLGDFGLAKDDIMCSASPAVTPVDLLQRSTFNLTTSSATIDHTSGVGTQAYASPEQLNSSKITPYSDMYSLGIVLYELYTKFTTCMERVNSLTLLRDEGVSKLSTDTNPEILTLVSSLMHPIPELRPSAIQLIQDRFSDSEMERIEKLKLQEKVHLLKKTVQSQRQELFAQADVISSQRKELDDKEKMLKEKDKEILCLRKLLAERDGSLINM